jgi:hypothetical protein
VDGTPAAVLASCDLIGICHFAAGHLLQPETAKRNRADKYRSDLATHGSFIAHHTGGGFEHFALGLAGTGSPWDLHNHLPTAEYDSHGDLGVGDVLELAKAAANETRKAASIIVTEAVRRQWHNLPPAG